MGFYQGDSGGPLVQRSGNLKAVGDKSLSRICLFARLEELNIFNTSLSDESKV